MEEHSQTSPPPELINKEEHENGILTTGVLNMEAVRKTIIARLPEWGINPRERDAGDHASLIRQFSIYQWVIGEFKV